MISQELLNAFRNFDANPPAQRGEIERMEQLSGIKLPAAYSAYLSFSNGGAGMIGENCHLILWQIGEILELNVAYEVALYAPGIVLIGSNGGGEAICFDQTANSEAIFAIPFVGMDRCYLKMLGETFDDFILNWERE
jgi:hypothetical protein